MSQTPNLGLTKLEVGQHQKEATINENLDIIDQLGSFVGARVYGSANQSITSATVTALSFNTERYDTDLIHDNSTNPTRLTCNTAGKYSIKGTAGFAGNATGWRALYIRVGGTTTIAGVRANNIGASDALYLTVTADYDLAEGSYVELLAEQTSGGALNVIVSANSSYEFMMHLVSVSAGGAGGGGAGDALTTDPLSQFAATTSAQLRGVMTDETGSGSLVFGTSATLTSPTISGVVAFPDDVRQTFNPGTTVPGLNIGSLAGNPSTPINADIWYNSIDEKFKFRQAGATVELGTGLGDVSAAANFGTDNRIIRSDGTSKGVQSSAITIDDSGNVTGVNSIAVGDGTVAGESKLFELTANGSNYISLLAPDSITNTLRLKFPNADPTAGQALVFGVPSSNISTGAWMSVGYINVPSNSQSANYTLVLDDAGKAIDHPSTDANARTFTIPANSSVAFPVGTAVTFTNMTSQVVSIAITTDTLYLAGTGTTGTRSLAQYGTATARKLTSTTWLISGVGLT